MWTACTLVSWIDILYSITLRACDYRRCLQDHWLIVNGYNHKLPVVYFSLSILASGRSYFNTVSTVTYTFLRSMNSLIFLAIGWQDAIRAYTGRAGTAIQGGRIRRECQRRQLLFYNISICVFFGNQSPMSSLLSSYQQHSTIGQTATTTVSTAASKLPIKLYTNSNRNLGASLARTHAQSLPRPSRPQPLHVELLHRKRSQAQHL